jgi:hypothetical protein
MNKHSYEYSYRWGGKDYLGTAVHDNDEDAIGYYRSLVANGKIEMYSLRRNGIQLWERRFSVKTGAIIAGLQPKFI